MKSKLLLIKNLPPFILEIFNYDIKKLYNHISILNNSISEGVVYKIHVEGSLEENGYESGFLYLTKGSSIKEHTHTTDTERYILVFGDLKINGNSSLENECFIGESHCIDTVSRDTLVCTYKKKQLTKKLLPSVNVVR